jgi:uncharacterized tellurite resistance protein B-like protein
MPFHQLLKNEVARNVTGLLGASMFTLWAACGFPWRSRRHWGREGHSPFESGEYTAANTIGTILGLGAVAWMAWSLAANKRRLHTLRQTQDGRYFARAGAPRSIHHLLLAVASRDGRVDQSERDVVARLMLRELPDHVLPQDLANWAAANGTPQDPARIAKVLAASLSLGERRMVLRWCREVAAADLHVAAEESDVLRRLDAVLGEPKPDGPADVSRPAAP